MQVQRFGSVVKVKPEKIEEYKKLHASVWPDVLEMISKCNIRNYSIYYYKDDFLFSFFEYTSKDYKADMKKWRLIPLPKNGGRYVSLARSHYLPVLRANGGLIWKKYSIMINLLLR